MATTQQSQTPQRREFHEATWEFLMIEFVDLIYGSEGGDDNMNLIKFERMGYSVGQRLIERATKEKPRFGETLEIIKFICKEFWLDVFKKQVDNLRTNHRGVFVLQDNKFRWLLKMSSSSSGVTKTAALRLLQFPCGIIRGAISNLGIAAEVTVEVTTLPSCFFTIKVKA